MEIGKLKNEVLGDLVFSEIKPIRNDILIRPGVGEDCTAIEFGDLACVITTDPITGSGSQLGRLAVHVCLNDIASSGAEPVGLLLTLLCPEGTEKSEIQAILREANQAANEMNVEIVGGHTEITTAVNRMIVSATAVGKTIKKKLIKTAGAKPGNYIYLTKQAATEGTAIIAHDKAKELASILTHRELEEARNLMDQISVVPEGKIGARVGVSAMHDVTEGGVLGAVHEVCAASGVGCHIKWDRIKILEVTEKICEFYHLNPMKLISSGSMLMCVDKNNAGALEKAFIKAGIEYSNIGVITESTDKLLVMGDGEEAVWETIESPDSDELYKVIN